MIFLHKLFLFDITCMIYGYQNILQFFVELQIFITNVNFFLSKLFNVNMILCKNIHDHSKYTIQQRELEIIGIMNNKIYLKEFLKWNRQNNIRIIENQDLKIIHINYLCDQDCYLLDNSIIIQVTKRRFFLISRNKGYVKTIIQNGGEYHKTGHNTFVQIRRSNQDIRYYKRLSGQCKQVRIFRQSQYRMGIQVSNKILFIQIYLLKISYYIQLQNAKKFKLDLRQHDSCLSQNGQHHVFIMNNTLKQIKIY
ncbi:hypothetical protein pb186bvf_012398 [Paramecium bursaria]